MTFLNGQEQLEKSGLKMNNFINNEDDIDHATNMRL